MSKLSHRACGALIAGLALGAAPGAWAALGGNVASVLHDSAVLSATHSVTSFAAYDLHESTTADGMRLREYVDRSGTVFALSWRGPRAPDVSALLGSYAAQYHAAPRTRLSNHHVATVDEPGLVVTVMRLPRGWQGHAFVPAAIPAGVDRAELR